MSDVEEGMLGTDPNDGDTENDGMPDGQETDPTVGHGADDVNVPGYCAKDSNCGNATSGMICDDKTNMCVSGCRGEGGNDCPSRQTCTSTTSGACVCTCEAGGTYAGWGHGILFTTHGHPLDTDHNLGWLFGVAGALALTLRRRSSQR